MSFINSSAEMVDSVKVNLYLLLFIPFISSCLEKSSCLGHPLALLEYSFSPISLALVLPFLAVCVGVAAGVVLFVVVFF